jgi:hypothetical protein
MYFERKLEKGSLVRLFVKGRLKILNLSKFGWLMKSFFKLEFLAMVVLIIWGLSANASVAQSVLTGNFEGGGAFGKFVYQDNASGLSISYYSSSSKRNFTYTVAKYDECSSMAMYAIPNVNQVAIDGSCASQGGQIYRYVYEWKKNYSNWCLVREITGEKADVTSGIVAPTEQVARVVGCPTIGMEGPYRYESDSQAKNEINAELVEFRAAKIDQSEIKRYLEYFPSYNVSELISYINSSNVQDINDLAFFLSENGRSYDAIPVLEKIVKNFPARIVAKLNLADAYWDNGFKDLAIPFYAEYSSKMKSSGFEAKIPERVRNRIAK